MKQNRFYREPQAVRARPELAIAKLHDFTRCLEPHMAIVDRPALEEVLEYLARTKGEGR